MAKKSSFMPRGIVLKQLKFG
ncbi:hypothetical protein A2U01_0116249, partial [Trifolium medium]|nr:hypothetical protein [Trifolium medium]